MVSSRRTLAARKWSTVVYRSFESIGESGCLRPCTCPGIPESGRLFLAFFVDRDANLAAGAGHGLALDAGDLAFDVEILHLAEVEQALVEIGPLVHAATVYVVRQVVDIGQAKAFGVQRLLGAHAGQGLKVHVKKADVADVAGLGAVLAAPAVHQLARACLAGVAPGAQVQHALVGGLRLPRKAMGRKPGAMQAASAGQQLVGLGVDDEVDIALAVQGDVLVAVACHGLEAHGLEQPSPNGAGSARRAVEEIAREGRSVHSCDAPVQRAGFAQPGGGHSADQCGRFHRPQAAALHGRCRSLRANLAAAGDCASRSGTRTHQPPTHRPHHGLGRRLARQPDRGSRHPARKRHPPRRPVPGHALHGLQRCSANLATQLQDQGLNYSITSACSTSAHCIGAAAQQIAWGMQDVMFAGGGEELSLGPAVLVLTALGAMSSKYNDQPAQASRPYDASRDGFVIAGGGGALVLESLEHAQARGANILGEIVGFGISSDGEDMLPHSGEGAVAAMQQAIAGLAEPVDYINTHGTSTPVGDVPELHAIRKVFWRQKVAPFPHQIASPATRKAPLACKRPSTA
ncbi:hypothetical protein FQA39_LY19266 [Lamprigera yunnana]|nr:hypothetical protein FQA39_LY19266 [Lamprigera yunnana]